MTRHVRDSFREGFGWQVTDCAVTMNDVPLLRRGRAGETRGNAAHHGRRLPQADPDRRHERPGASGDGGLRAGRPAHPRDPDGVAWRGPAGLARLGAAVEAPIARGELAVVETALAAARVQGLRRQLPGLTGGEGVLESDFGGYRPVGGAGADAAEDDRQPAQPARSTCRASRDAPAPDRTPDNPALWFVRALAQLLIVVAIVFAIAAGAAVLLAIVSDGEFVDGLRIMALLIGALLVLMGATGGGFSRAADAEVRQTALGRLPGIPSWAESQSDEPQLSSGAAFVISGLALVAVGLVIG